MLVVSSKARIVADQKSWIEGEATRQLAKVAEHQDIVSAIGMPDLHPGHGYPVGAVFLVQNRIFPAMIGSDIGCGMALWRTSIRPGKPERMVKKLKGLDHGVEDPLTYLSAAGVSPCGFEHTLGTVGHGNHFAELLSVDVDSEPDRVAEILGDTKSVLLVHSGSRGYGEEILRAHTVEHRDHGIPITEVDVLADYLTKHEHACNWARVNRRVIADRILNLLGANGEMLFDIQHNFVERYIAHIDPNDYWVHRKGAIPSNRGPVVIPGSRGAHSYLVEPLGNDAETGWSLSHGAGRKMSRKDARIKFDQGNRFGSVENLAKTKFNSVVICEDRQLLMEEHPDAYKPIERVIQDLVDHKLVRVLAILKPFLTYKVTRNEHKETNKSDTT